MTSFAGPKVQLFHGSVEETLAAADGMNSTVEREKPNAPTIRVDTALELPSDAISALVPARANHPSGTVVSVPFELQRLVGADRESLGLDLLPSAIKKPLISMSEAQPDPREIYLPREFEPNSLPKVRKLGASVDLCGAAEVAGGSGSIKEVCDKVSLNVEMDPGGALLRIRSRW